MLSWHFLIYLIKLLHSSPKTMFPTGLVVSVVDPHPCESIVDCCAAPGGKTLFLASRLNGQGNYCEIRTYYFAEFYLTMQF